MHSSQKLVAAFRKLIALVEDEAARNPIFAEKLNDVVGSLPAGHSQRRPAKRSGPQAPPPDIFAAYQDKGDEEFRFWLRSMSLSVLKAIVKTNGFDPGKASQRWTEPDKFAALIADQTLARLRRGSAFLGRKTQGGSEE